MTMPAALLTQKQCHSIELRDTPIIQIVNNGPGEVQDSNTITWNLAKV
jgi:hypothetical protein